MPLPAHASALEKTWHWTFLVFCGLVFLFLILPVFVILPLSFNQLPYFTFTKEMVTLDPDGYSLRWYEDFANSKNWQQAVRNSVIISIASTLLSTTLGTIAALGLSQSNIPYRTTLMAALISPMIVPLIISAASMFFFYSAVGLQGTHLGVILAHTALATPFVVITVTATLSGFDRSMIRAGLSLGASPTTVFFKVVVPLILPGVISGALFAFITSFDEVVVVLFVGGVHQRTIPWQMFSGIREHLSPTILAVATILVVVSVLLLTMVELLRRRNERMRGLSPG